MVGGVPVGDAGEHITHPSFGVNEVEPDGLDERLDRRCPLAAFVGAEEAVLGALLSASVPHLAEGGRIVTIGSAFGERVPFPGITIYAMSKAALTSFTRGLGPNGITVNLVRPGRPIRMQIRRTTRLPISSEA